MSFNQVENHFEPFLRSIDCEVVLNICLLRSIVQISPSLFGTADQAMVRSLMPLPQIKSKTKSFTLLVFSQGNNTGLYRGELVAYCLWTKNNSFY